VPGERSAKGETSRGHRRSIRLRGYDYGQAGAYFVTLCALGRACAFGEVVDGVMRLNACGTIVDALWRAIPVHFPGTSIDEYVVMPNHLHGVLVLVGAPFMAPSGVTTTAPEGAMNRAPTAAPGAMDRVSVVPEGAMNRAPTAAPGTVDRVSVVPEGAMNRAPTAAPGTVDRVSVVPEGAMNRAPTAVPGTMARVSVVPEGAMNRAPTLGGIVRAFKARVTRAVGAPVWQRNYYEHILRDEASLSRTRQYIRDNPAQWESDDENPAFVGARFIAPSPRRVG
jgi:putative transposase